MISSQYNLQSFDSPISYQTHGQKFQGQKSQGESELDEIEKSVQNQINFDSALSIPQSPYSRDHEDFQRRLQRQSQGDIRSKFQQRQYQRYEQDENREKRILELELQQKNKKIEKIEKEFSEYKYWQEDVKRNVNLLQREKGEIPAEFVESIRNTLVQKYDLSPQEAKEKIVQKFKEYGIPKDEVRQISGQNFQNQYQEKLQELQQLQRQQQQQQRQLRQEHQQQRQQQQQQQRQLRQEHQQQRQQQQQQQTRPWSYQSGQQQRQQRSLENFERQLQQKSAEDMEIIQKSGDKSLDLNVANYKNINVFIKSEDSIRLFLSKMKKHSGNQKLFGKLVIPFISTKYSEQKWSEKMKSKKNISLYLNDDDLAFLLYLIENKTKNSFCENDTTKGFDDKVNKLAKCLAHHNGKVKIQPRFFKASKNIIRELSVSSSIKTNKKK